MQINLANCTNTIVNEIENGFTQKSVALSYAMAMRSEMAGTDQPDWRRINKAILARWKPSGLDRIKKRAWDLVKGRAQP